MAKQRRYDPNYVGPINNIKKLLNGKLIYLKVNKDPITGAQSFTEFVQKSNETAIQFKKRIAVLRDEGIKAARAIDALPIKELNENIKNWSDKWFKENFKKNIYKPREADRFLENFKKDWKKEVKEKGYKRVGSLDPSKAGYPNLFGDQKNVNRYKVGSYPIGSDLEKGERNFRKAFFENQLKTDSKFKSELDNYFSYFIKNKSGTSNQYMKVKPPASVRDAVYWLSDDSKIKGVSRTDMFAKIPSLKKTFDEYQQKFSKTSSALKNKNLIEKALGLRKNTIQRLQNKEGAALKKLFGVTTLPQELAYSVEHTQGLAVAARSGSKRMMKTAISDLAGMTAGENSRLGWSPGTFELTRKRSVNEIQEGLKNGKNMSKKVNELNRFIFEEYGDNISKNKKPYSIVGNKLRTSLISEAKNQSQRFGQYFNELASKPEATQTLLERINTRPELRKFIQKGKDPILTSLRSNVIKLAENNTDNFCNILSMRRADGGRMGFAKGGSCATQVADKFDADPKKFAQDVNKIPEQPGVINQAKSAATKFLTAIKSPGSFRGKVALGAGAVISGFGAGALVKQFKNDDPSTYLNNESQMEGMLISDVEEAGSKVEDNPILNNQFKLEALAAAGITAPIAKGVYNTQRFGTPQLLETPMELDQEMKTLKRTVRQITHPGGKKAKRIGAAAQETIRMARQRMAELNKYIVETTDPLISSGKGPIRSALGLSGVLGKGLWAFTSPIVALPSTAMYIAKDKMEGKSTTDALTNPLTYLGPAFMNQSVKALAKAGASRGLLAIASAGLAGTAAAPLLPAIAIGSGIAAAGSLGYQAYKKFFDKTDPEAFN